MSTEGVFEAVILGILQGLTEFLPISSSAHLILLPWFFGWRPMGIVFDVVVHTGTLLAVLIYFWEDWKQVAAQCLRRIRKPFERDNLQLTEAIFIGTLPAIVVGLTLRGTIERYARSPLVTVFTLALFGLLLWWADTRKGGDRLVGGIRLRDGLIVGVAQSLALIPGVSRSGITITMALILGFSRSDSARFSFLLSGPIIALAAMSGILDLVTGKAVMGEGSYAVLVVGVVVSFVVGLACIKYFLRFLKDKTYLPFVVYRIGLAAAILLLYFLS